MHPP
jgi:hypothetical protein